MSSRVLDSAGIFQATRYSILLLVEIMSPFTKYISYLFTQPFAPMQRAIISHKTQKSYIKDLRENYGPKIVFTQRSVIESISKPSVSLFGIVKIFSFLVCFFGGNLCKLWDPSSSHEDSISLLMSFFFAALPPLGRFPISCLTNDKFCSTTCK